MCKKRGIQWTIPLSWAAGTAKLLQQICPSLWSCYIPNAETPSMWNTKDSPLPLQRCMDLGRYSLCFERGHCYTYPETGEKSILCFKLLALTSCLGKLFEKMINHRLLHFLESNSLTHTSAGSERVGPPPTISYALRQKSVNLLLISSFSYLRSLTWRRHTILHEGLGYWETSHT